MEGINIGLKQLTPSKNRKPYKTSKHTTDIQSQKAYTQYRKSKKMYATVYIGAMLALTLCGGQAIGLQGNKTTTTTVLPSTMSAGQMNAEGQCVCVLKQPESSCSETGNYHEIVKLRSHVAHLTATVKSYELISLKQRLDTLDVSVTAFKARFSKQSVAVSVSQLTQLQLDVKSVHALVAAVSANGTATVTMKQIQKELKSISGSLTVLQSQNPIAQKHVMEAQVASLRARVANCRETASNHSFTRFRGDSLALSQSFFKDRCRNIESVHIGEPETHVWRSGMAKGGWYRDSSPQTETDKKKIYLLNYDQYHSAANGQLMTYLNYTDLATNLNVKKSSQLGYWYGTGWVVYKGHLFFHDGTNVKKFNLKNNRVVATLKLPSVNQAYLGGIVSYVDLHVDETGMYAIYKTSARSSDMVISKINPENMSVNKTWHTARSKESIRNVIVICGKMYTLDYHGQTSNRNTEARHFTFDTITGKSGQSTINVIQKYGSLAQLSYNPRETALFGWDNQHLVTYPVTFKYTNDDTPTTTTAYPVSN